MPDFDLVIIGAGIAGLTAASFAGNYGLRTLVIDRFGPGGQITTATRIDNFPGFPQGIVGHELGPLLHEQAEAAGAEFRLDEVERIEAGAGMHFVHGAADSVSARALIIATGSAQRPLGIPGEERLAGKGVSHCASCDGPLFRGKAVAVIGGGDSGVDEALVLAEHAARVTLFHRGSHLAAQRSLVDRAAASPKIEIVVNALAEEILGEGAVTGLRLRDEASGVVRQCDFAGVFVAIGLEPNTALLRGLVALDAGGHIKTDLLMQSSVPGIFAAGDIRHASAAQLAAAAGDGCTAAISAFRYLEAQG